MARDWWPPIDEPPDPLPEIATAALRKAHVQLWRDLWSKLDRTERANAELRQAVQLLRGRVARNPKPEGSPMLIAVVNASTVVPDAQIQPYVDAQVHQFRYNFCPAWGLVAPAMAVYKNVADIPAGAQALIVYDDSDQAGALAYHTETAQGVVLSRVFARTLLDNGVTWTSGASHEALEMRADAACNRNAEDPHGRLYALEVCDPVEATAYPINRIEMSDFVHPAWFDPQAPVGTRTRHATAEGEINLAPFHLAKGGYAIVNNQPVYGDTYPDWRKGLKGAGSRTAKRVA